MMCVITVVFSTIFKQNIPNFPIYYLSGSLIFSFNSEATTNAMHSILSNCSLIKKVYLPKYLFPISCVLSSLVNLGFSLVADVYRDDRHAHAFPCDAAADPDSDFLYVPVFGRSGHDARRADGVFPRYRAFLRLCLFWPGRISPRFSTRWISCRILRSG